MTVKRAVLGLVAIVAGYALGRRLRGWTPSSGGLRERAGEALPGDGVEVPIGGTDEEGASDAEEAIAGADPTLEEVDERTGENVGETPAEPGEMQVDEEVVEEAVDSTESETDEGDEAEPDDRE